MRRAAIVALVLLVSSTALADQGWQDNQDGSGFICYDVGTIQINNLIGSGTRCVQVDSTGKLIASSTACGGTVTSVAGTAGQILCAPSSPNPVCSLINAGAGAGSCTNCSVTFDALGREATYSSGTAPVTTVTGSHGVACSPTTGAAACTLDNFTCGAGTFVSSASTSGGLACTAPTAGADALATYEVASSSHAPVNAVNLGALTSGVNEQTVSGGVATPTVFSTTNHRVPFGSTGGQLQDSANLQFDGANFGVGGTPSIALHVQGNVNGDLMGGIANASTGTGARSLWAFGSVAFANPSLTLLVDGVNYASAGGLYTSGSSIWYYNASATSHLLFQNQNGDTIFTTGSSPVGGVVKLGISNGGHVVVADLSAGGMVKATATTLDGFSVGQLAPAVAGTDYQAPIAGNICGTNNFATSISTAGALTCTQPSFANLSGTMSLAQEPTIAAHTILANGTGAAAQAAQTSIGTTLAFDGTAQLQSVGLRDGGGVNHITTGTWGLSSVLETDISGNVAAEAQISCGQSEGPWTGDATKSAGSCAVKNVALTETSGPTSLIVGAIPNLAPEFDVMGRPAGTSTIVGVAGSLVADSITKRSYALQASLSPSIGTCGLFSGGNGLGAGCTLVEYPNDFVARHIQITANFPTNTITAGTLSFLATLNGSAISGTTIAFTSASSAGVTSTATVATGSTAATDKIGWAFTTSAGYSGGFQTTTFIMVLSP